MALKELREAYTAKSKEIRDYHASIEKEDRAWTKEEQESFDTRQKEISDIEQRIKNAEKLEDRQFEADEASYRSEEKDRFEFEARKREKDGVEDDPNRPVTEEERSKAILAWISGAYADEAGRRAAERCGINILARELPLDTYRGADEFGNQFRAPRNKQEVREQSRARREARIRERENYRPERRALSTLTAGAGGNTIPDEMMRPIEESLLQWGGMRQVSTILTTDTGADLPIPTNDDTANTGEIVADSSSHTEQDTTFGQIVLQSYKYSSKFVKVSVELLQDSSVGMVDFLGRALGTRIGRITNKNFTDGTGTGEPTGVVTAAGNSGITAATAGELAFDEVIDLKHSVDPAYRGNGSFMMHDSTLSILKQMKDSQNRPLWLPNLIPGEPSTFDGDPYTINQSMPTGATAKGLLYGDFSKYLIRDVRGITLVRLDELYAISGQVGFLSFARYDGNLLDAGTDPVKFLTLA